MPATNRNKRSPAPGQPRAKVENSLFKMAFLTHTEPTILWGTPRGLHVDNRTASPEVGKLVHPLEGLQFDDASLQCNRHRLGAIIGAELGEDVFDSALNRFFANREVSSNLLIRVSVRDQP